MGSKEKASKQAKRMLGAQAVIASLEAEGVSLVFGYPGAQAIKIYDALYYSEKITHVLACHEQGAVHEADGYARSTGKPGVVIVSSGPGATNTVTGVATAYMDSVPLIVITAQVPRSVIGTDSFQESDTVGITMPVVKHSFLLQSTAELTRIFHEAFHIASTGRPGPVLIDIPSDLLGQEMDFEYPEKVNIPSYKPTIRGNAKQVRAAAQLIERSLKPVILAGGGVIASGATEELCEIAHMRRIPVVTTLMAKGAVPSSDPLNLGHVGMHGSKFANLALNESDLIIACGARFSDRVTGQLDSFAPYAKLIHIDIDPAEIGKVRTPDIPIVGDLKHVLGSLRDVLRDSTMKVQTAEWVETVKDWRTRYPIYDNNLRQAGEAIEPEMVLKLLSDMLDPEESIVVTEVGQHQMWAAQFVDRELPRTFITSGGLGTMGFGFPAAIGASFANPGKQVVCIAGDGSFQMNVQEMATAATYGIPVKVLILDNRALGMVRQWQSLFYGRRFEATELPENPDFVKLAEAYGWQGARVDERDAVPEAIEKLLAAAGPSLLDVRIPRDCNVFPMVAPGRALTEVIGAIDSKDGAKRIIERLEDLTPEERGERA